MVSIEFDALILVSCITTRISLKTDVCELMCVAMQIAVRPNGTLDGLT